MKFGLNFEFNDFHGTRLEFISRAVQTVGRSNDGCQNKGLYVTRTFRYLTLLQLQGDNQIFINIMTIFNIIYFVLEKYTQSL